MKKETDERVIANQKRRLLIENRLTRLERMIREDAELNKRKSLVERYRER